MTVAVNMTDGKKIVLDKKAIVVSLASGPPGKQGDVTAALDTFRSDQLNYGKGVYMNGGLRNWHHSTKQIRDIILFGDSLTGVGYTHGWGKKLRRRLDMEMNKGLIGQGIKHNWHPNWSYAGGLGWPTIPTSDSKDKGLVGTRYTGTAVTDGGPTVIATYTPEAGEPSDFIDIYWIDGGTLVFGNWQFSKDGGSTWTTIDSVSGYTRSGTTNIVKTTVTGPITTSFKIRASSNGSNTVGVAFAGIGLRGSSALAYGTRLHECGRPGNFLATLMRTTSGSPLAMLSHVTPDLGIVIASNDVLLTDDPTGFGTNLTNLVVGTRLFFSANCDFLFICPPEQGDNRDALRGRQLAYRNKTKEVAATYGFSVLDLGEAWGTLEEGLAAGYMDVDEVHFTDAGNTYIADQIARMIL